ncbi:MAG TPA: VTT domain-containing protein [Solirubrobacteraceae bacterium]
MTSRHASTLCLSGLAVTGVYSLATIPLAPSLLGSHPVLLEALRGSTPAMVTAGAFARVGRASLVLALLAPLVTLLMSDPLLWWAGRIWGPNVAKMLTRGGPRAQRRTERAVRLAERYGSWAVVLSYFLPVPSVLIYAGAGWTGMSLRRFLALDLLGTSLWIAANVGLGYSIGQSAVDVAKEVSHYGLILTLALLAIIPVIAARRARNVMFEG